MSETLQAEKIIGSNVHVAGRTPVGLANDAVSAEERLEPGFDQFTLTAEDRKRFNIADDEVPALVRNPAAYTTPGSGNRLLEIKHDHPGARVIMENGFPVTAFGSDLALVALKREEMEIVEAREREKQQEFTRKMETQEWEDSIDPSDRQQWKRRAAMSSAAIKAAGLAGENTPTAGRTLDQVLATISRAQPELDAMRAQRGERHITSEEREREEALREQVERYRSRSRNRTYSIPR